MTVPLVVNVESDFVFELARRRLRARLQALGPKAWAGIPLEGAVDLTAAWFHQEQVIISSQFAQHGTPEQIEEWRAATEAVFIEAVRVRADWSALRVPTFPLSARPQHDRP